MKKLLLLGMTALFCFACNDSRTVTVTVTNPLAMERSNEMVEVSMETVTDRLGLADTAQIVVLNVEGSSPFSHPKERGISVIIFLFFAIYQAFGGINPKRCRKEPHYK